MPRGRTRLPDSIAAMRGTDRRAQQMAQPPPGQPVKVPKPPKGLNAVQRRVWEELAEQVDELGTYRPTDRTAFGLMVRNVAMLEAGGDIAPTAYAHMQRAAAGWLARFGLTPADKGRVVPPPSAGGDRFGSGSADPVEAFLFGRPTLAVVKGGKRG